VEYVPATVIGDRLSALVGLWTRAVKLLKDTRDPTAPPVENRAKTM
jgi:hypothetical protein